MSRPRASRVMLIALLASSCTLAVTTVSAAAAASAVNVVTLDAPLTDNYKTKYNPPDFDERRTSVMFRAVVVNGVKYTTTAPPTPNGAPTTYADGLPLRAPDGTLAKLRPGPVPANAQFSQFRVFAADSFGFFTQLLNRDTFKTTPLPYSFNVVDGAGAAIGTVALEYRYDAVVATQPATSMEYKSPGGRWYVAGAKTPLDWPATLAVVAPATAVLNTPVNVRITATDLAGLTVVGYAFRTTEGNDVKFSVSPAGSATLPAPYQFTAADRGTKLVPVTFTSVGTRTVSASTAYAYGFSPATGTSAAVNVSAPAPASKLSVAAPTSASVGTAVSVTVTAQNPSGATTPGYVGKVHFTSTDTTATLPADYTFTAADAGRHVFPVTFRKAGSRTVTAQDVAVASITGTSAAVNVTNVLTVDAPFTDNYKTNWNPPGYDERRTSVMFRAIVVNGVKYTTTAPVNRTPVSYPDGLPLRAPDGTLAKLRPGPVPANAQNAQFRVFAADTFGLFTQVTNRDTFKTTPLPYTLNVVDSAGAAIGTVPLEYRYDSVIATQPSTSIEYKSAGGRWYVAGAKTPQDWPATLAVVAPATAVVGSPVDVRITATDLAGLTVVSYAYKANEGNDVKFTSFPAGKATLPAPYQFTAADRGTKLVPVTFTSVATHTVSASTVYAYGISPATGTSAGVNVTAAAAASKLLVAAPASTTVGIPISVTVTAQNPSGATVPGYLGKVHFTSTDTTATLPADYTFTAADGGRHVFSVTLRKAGSRTVTAQDVAVASITGTSAAVNVTNVVTLDGPLTDNYKTKYNPPDFDERRTSVMFRAVVVNGVKYTTTATPTPNGAPTTYADGLPLRAPDGTLAKLRPGPVPANAQFSQFRVFAADSFGFFTQLLNRDTFRTTPLPYTLNVVDGAGAAIGTVALEYRYDAVIATQPATSMEYKSPGGRWYVAGAKTPLDWPATLAVVAPATAVLNTPVNVRITATDLAGLTVVGYAFRTTEGNDVKFSVSPAGSATLPAPYQFTAADRGTKLVPVTFTSVGTRTVSASTAYAYGFSPATGTSAAVNVTAP